MSLDEKTFGKEYLMNDGFGHFIEITAKTFR